MSFFRRTTERSKTIMFSLVIETRNYYLNLGVWEIHRHLFISYRPITVHFLTLRKLFEKLLLKRIRLTTMNKGTVANIQFGLGPKYSTIHHIHRK